MKKLKIVFMGTPDFAVESLKILVENNKYHILKFKKNSLLFDDFNDDLFYLNIELNLTKKA